MSSDKIFKVGIFGLTPNEKNTLGSIFKLAASRPRKYTLIGPTERETAEIILVDIDNSDARSEWKSFSVHHSTTPVVRVTKSTPAEAPSDEVYLRRPLTLKRVLDILDQVTIKALKFVPELVVDDEAMLGEEDAATFNISRGVAASAAKSGVKALVVDDALSVRKHMEVQLGLYGMDINFAETGEDALEYIQENVYDIIFLDVMLPGVDGLKVCKEIKSHNMSKATPVVMLTGKDGKIDKIKGKMAGANEYLTKPVQQDKLKEVLNQFLPNAVNA